MDRLQEIIVECYDREVGNANHNDRTPDLEIAWKEAVEKAMIELFKRIEVLEKHRNDTDPTF